MANAKRRRRAGTSSKAEQLPTSSANRQTSLQGAAPASCCRSDAVNSPSSSWLSAPLASSVPAATVPCGPCCAAQRLSCVACSRRSSNSATATGKSSHRNAARATSTLTATRSACWDGACVCVWCVWLTSQSFPMRACTSTAATWPQAATYLGVVISGQQRSEVEHTDAW